MSVTISGSGQIVKQVVQAIYTTEDSTTSTSNVATGLQATITPTNAANKILVTISTNSTNTTTNANTILTIYRNATDIGIGPNTRFQNYLSISGWQYSPSTTIILDSPATTSAVTYRLYFKVTSGTGYVNSSQAGTVTLQEIAYA